MKKVLKATLITISVISVVGLFIYLPSPDELFVAPEKPEYYEDISIDMVFVSGHRRCATYSLPSNRKRLDISSSRGSYSLIMALPTRYGSGVIENIRNGVVDYQVVESC